MKITYDDMYVYIASPFFTPEQLVLVQRLEDAFNYIGVKHFSPRLHGKTIKNLPESERLAAAKEAFELNVKGLWDCNILLHVMDGKDLGAAWECGFWTGTYGIKNRQRPICILQTGDKPLNIMMQQVVLGFGTSVSEALGWFGALHYEGMDSAIKTYCDFGTNLT